MVQRAKLLGTATLAASLLAMPAFAQGGNANSATGTQAQATSNPGAAMYSNIGSGGYTAEQTYIRNGNGGNNAGNNNNGSNNNWRPSQRNPDLADNGDARASKVIGTAVYNEKDQKLGSVNDILIGKNGVFAILSTNNKKVAVPFNQLKFGNATNMGNDTIVLPNETQAKLNTEPVIHYNETNYQAARDGNNNGGGVFAGNGNNGPTAAGNGPFHGGNNGNPNNGGPFSGSNGPNAGTGNGGANGNGGNTRG